MYEALGSSLMMPADVSRGITPGGGKTFFISTTGLNALASDDNEGVDPSYPLLTIQAALDKCTDRKHDYIFCQDHYQEGATITIDKKFVHLIGLSGGSYLLPNIIEGETLTCMEIGASGDGLELAGFHFGSTGADAIVFTAIAWVLHIHHCAFAVSLTGQRALYSAASVGPVYSMIDHNWFGQTLTGNKIDLYVATRSAFNHNHFRVIAGIGITIHDSDIATILGNTFFSPILSALNDGWAIDLLSGVYGGLISGNRAGATGDGTGNNPYKDRSGAGVGTRKNGWADNFDGPALIASPA